MISCDEELTSSNEPTTTTGKNSSPPAISVGHKIAMTKEKYEKGFALGEPQKVVL